MKLIHLTNEEVVNETMRLLDENNEWEGRYDGYAKAILKKQG